MKTKVSFVVLIFMLIVSLLIVNFNFFVKADSKEIYVRTGYFGASKGTAEQPYKTIQEAIDIANPEDTIYVFGGLYEENLIIDKKIKIVGRIDEIDTIVDSKQDKRYLIEITADEVTIEGLTVRDADSATTSPIGALICLKSNDNRIINNEIKTTKSYGIYISLDSDGNFISNNVIDKSKTGVYIYSSSTNDIVNNDIANCSNSGIYVESTVGNNRIYGNYINKCENGIYAQNANSINITNNFISNCTLYGINFYNILGNSISKNNFYMNEGSSVYLRSSTCEVSENTFRYNQRGIFLESNNNIIKENKLYDSSASGVYTQINTINNIFYLNDFKGNTVSAREFGSNIWYYENQGNYWDDYILYDKDLDGIADEAYSNNGIYDLYPLGYFVKPPKAPYDPIPADKATGVGLHVTLQVTVEDPDSDELTVYFYKQDGTLLDGLTNNPVKKVSSNDFASFTFVLGFNTTFAWYAVVNDGILENQSSPFIFYTAVTPPDNIPPEADAGGPYSGRMDDIIQFDSSGSKDDDGKIDFYRWNFGDGSSEIIKENPTHSYSNQGTYIVTLTVIDNDGSSDSTTAEVDISYREFNPPTVNVLIPSTGKTGKSISFSSSGTIDPDGDVLLYLWDFGDGSTSTVKNPTHKYNKAGKYIVNLKVSDNKFSEEKSGVITITKPSEESPGFELVFLLLGISLLICVKKLNRKRKSR